MELFSHNKDAYLKVMEAFKTKDRAAIVHATGTGKSYIIAAVVQHFDKVLIIAPNNFVLDETRNVCKNGVKFSTYASVMYNYDKLVGFDLIVLDEFHRGGAKEWGKGVLELLELNPKAKILGTSATHIRYLDGERNMADELFDGNVVSTLPLVEAINRGILPDPVYVSSIYELGEIAKKYKKDIRSSRMSKVEKDEKIRHLEGLSSNWDRAEGIPRIIRKYFDSDMKRIIIFCSEVRKVRKMRKDIGYWLASAGYSRIRFYNIDYKEKRLEQEMYDFQRPVEEGTIKVALSVNMLNEGVHIPRVDGIIMLRSTISRIIIEQQIGRCLTANNIGRRPVVLDLVNNMELIRYNPAMFFGEYNETGDVREEKDKEGFPFKVIDECRDIRTFFRQLDVELSEDFLWKEYLPKFEDHFEKFGHLPTPTENRTLYSFMRNHKAPSMQISYPHRVEWFVSHGFVLEGINKRTLQEQYDTAVEYLDSNDWRMAPTTEREMNDIINNLLKYSKGFRPMPKSASEDLQAKVLELKDKIVFRNDIETRLCEIEKKYEETGRIDSNTLDRSWLNKTLRNRKITDDQRLRIKRVLQRKTLVVRKTTENSVLVDYVNENGLPTPENRKMYNCMMKFRKRVKGRYPAVEKDPETYAVLQSHGFDCHPQERDNRPLDVRLNEAINTVKANKGLDYKTRGMYYDMKRKHDGDERYAEFFKVVEGYLDQNKNNKDRVWTKEETQIIIDFFEKGVQKFFYMEDLVKLLPNRNRNSIHARIANLKKKGLIKNESQTPS